MGRRQLGPQKSIVVTEPCPLDGRTHSLSQDLGSVASELIAAHTISYSYFTLLLLFFLLRRFFLDYKGFRSACAGTASGHRHHTHVDLNEPNGPNLTKPYLS